MHSLTGLVARYLKGRHNMSNDLNAQSPPTEQVTEPSEGSETESPSQESAETASTETPSPLPQATPEQDAARTELKDAVARFTAAVENVAAVGLDPLAELQTAGFNFGSELPPVDMGGPGDETAGTLGHVPDGQLPPV